jgi:CMP-N,N'-diacetyllegionaminic acid synthase
LRLAEDIDQAIYLCEKNKSNFCVSVTESKIIPDWMFRINNRGMLEPLNSNREIPYQRQKAKKTYVLNGAVYVGRRESLIEKQSFLTPETIPYIMPNIRSIDIDDIDDFEYCEYLLERTSR